MNDEELRNALLDQWVEENENSSTYFYIGAFLKNKGLDNLGKMFVDGAKEELSHAEMILNLMTDLNFFVELHSIAEMTFPINTIQDIANKFLEREIQTTNSLIEIKNMCDGNGIVEEFIRKMISLQQKEMEEANSFMDKSLLLKEWWQVALWDLSLK